LHGNVSLTKSNAYAAFAGAAAWLSLGIAPEQLAHETLLWRFPARAKHMNDFMIVAGRDGFDWSAVLVAMLL